MSGGKKGLKGKGSTGGGDTPAAPLDDEELPEGDDDIWEDLDESDPLPSNKPGDVRDAKLLFKKQQRDEANKARDAKLLADYQKDGVFDATKKGSRRDAVKKAKAALKR